MMKWMLLIGCICAPTMSFLLNQKVSCTPSTHLYAISSKDISKHLATSVAINLMLLSPVMIHMNPSSSYANAAIIDDETSMLRFKASLAELQRLDKDWSTITKAAGAGDNIRRVLGTVYSPPNCDSPLCSSDKFVKRFVTNHLDDIDLDSFEGPSSQYLEALKNADFLAYSSIFSEFSGGGGIGDSSSANYIDMTRDQVKKAIVNLKDMITILESP